jgi:hypothetical protein
VETGTAVLRGPPCAPWDRAIWLSGAARGLLQENTLHKCRSAGAFRPASVGFDADAIVSRKFLATPAPLP